MTAAFDPLKSENMGWNIPGETLPLSLVALQFAQAEIGKEEIPRGSNWGPNVQKYLLSVGINFPAYWCMAFMYWCIDQAAVTIQKDNPAFKTGGVLHQWEESHAKYGVTTPQPGDIFIMDFGHGLGHTGIVESVNGDSLRTIEGNTNDTGSREGYEVCRRNRSAAKMKGFLRFT